MPAPPSSTAPAATPPAPAEPAPTTTAPETSAPEPAPSTAPPGSPAPGTAPAPPGYPPYPQPYGAAPYPGYPPYYGYPPGYYPYPPQQQRPREPAPRYPDDSSVRSSPFIEMLVGGQNFNKRFESYFNVGLQAGLFIGGRIRLAGRILMFPADPDDDFNDDVSGQDVLPFGFTGRPAEPPSFLFGGSLGVAAARTANFALSPGILVLTTDQADEYGSFFGVALPFDWVTDTGLRVGFELAIGRAMGGRVLARCDNFNTFPGGPPPQPGECANGEQRLFDREAGAGFYSHFHLGWGFDHPKPIGQSDSR